MIKIFKISILITILAVFTNCKTGNGYKIEGNIKNEENVKVFKKSNKVSGKRQSGNS